MFVLFIVSAFPDNPSFPRRRESLFPLLQNTDARLRGHDDIELMNKSKMITI